MVGTAIVSFAGAVMQWLTMTLLGLPLAIPISILMFFGGFIPYIGSFIVTMLGFLIAVAVGSTADIVLMGDLHDRVQHRPGQRRRAARLRQDRQHPSGRGPARRPRRRGDRGHRRDGPDHPDPRDHLADVADGRPPLRRRPRGAVGRASGAPRRAPRRRAARRPGSRRRRRPPEPDRRRPTGQAEAPGASLLAPPMQTTRAARNSSVRGCRPAAHPVATGQRLGVGRHGAGEDADPRGRGPRHRRATRRRRYSEPASSAGSYASSSSSRPRSAGPASRYSSTTTGPPSPGDEGGIAVGPLRRRRRAPRGGPGSCPCRGARRTPRSAWFRSPRRRVP